MSFIPTSGLHSIFTRIYKTNIFRLSLNCRVIPTSNVHQRPPVPAFSIIREKLFTSQFACQWWLNYWNYFRTAEISNCLRREWRCVAHAPNFPPTKSRPWSCTGYKFSYLRNVSSNGSCFRGTHVISRSVYEVFFFVEARGDRDVNRVRNLRVNANHHHGSNICEVRVITSTLT